ncbi:hypothetical protein [Massilia genomosp. 1]|uniref:hypothetical protein n=1 Tax=Massilia genomosp. 1 TaxID=2609280 RepID=UPI001C9E9996|nr:hypothetical protein [Massilia genomosp. 1]
MERWQKPGEIFTCTWLAVRSENTVMQDDVLKLMCRRPDELIRGVISALAACPSDYFIKIAKRWSAINAAPAAQVGVLRAASLRGRTAFTHLDNPLQVYLQSQTAHIRAAACRACTVVVQPGSVIPLLRETLSDFDLQVRAEASPLCQTVVRQLHNSN